MPCLKILTNLPKHRVPSDFAEKIIPTLSKAVNKEPQKFTCVIQSDCQMYMFGDSQAPGAVCTLESIGNLGPKENIIITEKLSAFLETELGVVPKRFFLTFYDMAPHNVGFAGTTVKDLLTKS